MRQLTEMDLLLRGIASSSPANPHQETIHEMNYKRLPDERRNILFNLQTKISPHYYNIMARKSRSKEHIEKFFSSVRKAVSNQSRLKKAEVALR